MFYFPKKIRFGNCEENVPYFEALFEDTYKQFCRRRDQRLVDFIDAEINEGKDVMVVFGVFHAISNSRILIDRYGPPIHSDFNLDV